MDFYEFLQFLKAEIHQINKIFRAPEMAKTAFSALLDPQN